MTLPKKELSRRRMAVAYKEMRAALSIALEKATMIEKEMEGVDPPTLSKQNVLPEEELTALLSKSRARRNIPNYPNHPKE